MKYNFIQLRINIIGPHTSNQISFPTQTCVIGYWKDLQLLVSIVKWINQIPTDEVNVHIVEMKDITGENFPIVSSFYFI